MESTIISAKKQVLDYNFSEIDPNKFGAEALTVKANIEKAKKAGVKKFKGGRVAHTGDTNLMFNALAGVYTHKAGKVAKNILHKIR